MGRELKRVPMNFNYPLDKTWYGKLIGINYCMNNDHKNYDICRSCIHMAQNNNIPLMGNFGCPDFYNYFKPMYDKLNKLCEPPNGPGYQLWSTTIDGPTSPVFESYDQLCDWGESNATIFGDIKLSYEEWKNALLYNGIVYEKDIGK